MDLSSVLAPTIYGVPWWLPAVALLIVPVVVLLKRKGAVKTTTQIDNPSPSGMPTAEEYAKAADEPPEEEFTPQHREHDVAKTFFEILGAKLNEQAGDVRFRGTLLKLDIKKADGKGEGIDLGNGLMAVPSGDSYGQITATLGEEVSETPPPTEQAESESQEENDDGS